MKAISKSISTLILIAGLSLLANTTQAASACKGLDESACDNASACGWVDGYERKDGRKVKSFCRTKSTGKKVAKASKSTPAKATASN